jgi:hypothetical protein
LDAEVFFEVREVAAELVARVRRTGAAAEVVDGVRLLLRTCNFAIFSSRVAAFGTSEVLTVSEEVTDAMAFSAS